MAIPAPDHNPAQVLRLFQRITAWEDHLHEQSISKQTALKGAMYYLTPPVKIIRVVVVVLVLIVASQGGFTRWADHSVVMPAGPTGIQGPVLHPES